ncbi:MAG: N-acetyltransferase [Cytophagaceae bacterium]|nr:N-acetyltransferase [Cytophagaceae bacterium]
MKYEEIPLANNEANHRFELVVEGQTAVVEYTRTGQSVALNHTEVPKVLEGQGVGSAIVEKTLRYLEANRLRLVPRCSFVVAYLKRHPEWERLR